MISIILTYIKEVLIHRILTQLDLSAQVYVFYYINYVSKMADSHNYNKISTKNIN
jgi:hypothetical protein